MNFDVIDHLVYAAPDLDAAVAAFAARTGVTPSPGGAHPNWGTRNALVALGPRMYLEIIGPDPEQRGFEGVRPFLIDELNAARLVTWAAKAAPMERVVARAIERGYDPGPVFPGRRQRPDGVLLEWTLTMPRFDECGGVVPFLIDWGDSAHPAESAASGCSLRRFELRHPEARAARATLVALGIDAEVAHASQPELIAEIDTPAGTVQLGRGGIE